MVKKVVKKSSPARKRSKAKKSSKKSIFGGASGKGKKRKAVTTAGGVKAAKAKGVAGSAADDPKDILKYIKLAMETEKRGIKFYTAAKKQVQDWNMTQLMDVLLEQENKHLEFFTAIYNAEKKGGTEEAAKVAASYRKQPMIRNPLFSMKHLQSVVKQKATIYELFRKAVEFEEDGNALYLDIAKKVKNPKIKAFLKMVANEELRHRDFIITHQESVYNTGHWFGWDHVRLET